MSARNAEELRLGIAMLLASDAKRPMLLEVFTGERLVKKVDGVEFKAVEGKLGVCRGEYA